MVVGFGDSDPIHYKCGMGYFPLEKYQATKCGPIYCSLRLSIQTKTNSSQLLIDGNVYSWTGLMSEVSEAMWKLMMHAPEIRRHPLQVDLLDLGRAHSQGQGPIFARQLDEALKIHIPLRALNV